MSTISNSQKHILWMESFNGNRHSCPICDYNMIEKNNFHTGHIIAKSKGGSNLNDNLLPICQKCNLSMGTKYLISYWLNINGNNIKKSIQHCQLKHNKKSQIMTKMFHYLMNIEIDILLIGIHKQNIISTKYFSDVVKVDGNLYYNDPNLWINDRYSLFWSDFERDIIIFDNSIVMNDTYIDLIISGYNIIFTISQHSDVLKKLNSAVGYDFDFNGPLGINKKFNVNLQELVNNIIKKNDCYEYTIQRHGLKSQHNDMKGNFIIKVLFNAYN